MYAQKSQLPRKCPFSGGKSPPCAPYQFFWTYAQNMLQLTFKTPYKELLKLTCASYDNDCSPENCRSNTMDCSYVVYVVKH